MFKSTIQPYSLPDPGRRRRTIDSYLLTVTGAGLAVGIALAGWILYSDQSVKPDVAFDRDAWRVSFNVPGNDCTINSLASKTCLAHPENQALWSSDLRRDSAFFKEHSASNPGDSYWLGLKVPEADLQRALKASANVLVLPRMNGIVQVWIDGVYQKTHDFSAQRTPLMLTLPRYRLLEKREMSVVMGVFPYPHQPPPAMSRGSSRDGFFTTIEADHLSTGAVFFSTSLHFIAVALFLAVGAFLWSIASASRTRDFAVGTQLAFLVAVISLLSVDLSFRIVGVPTFERVYFCLLLCEAIVVIRLTATIAGSRRDTSRAEVIGIAVALALVARFAPVNWIEEIAVTWMTAVALPLTYGLCAVAVGIQLVGIKTRHSVASRTRFEFLVLAFLSLSLTSLAYVIESSGHSGFQVLWSRWLTLIWLVALIRVFVRSNKTKSSLIELSPVSKFHTTGPVPESVEGWVVKVEILKFSDNRQVMSTILSHLWTISRLQDAEVISADDRTLILIFAKADDGSEDQRLVESLYEMAKCTKDLEQRLPILFSTAPYPTSVLFRAAVERGSLRPEWRKSSVAGVARIPIWTETDARSMAAVEDLLRVDLDAAFRSSDSSIVVMRAAAAERILKRGFVSSRARTEVDPAPGVVAFIANRLLRKTKAAPGDDSGQRTKAL